MIAKGPKKKEEEEEVFLLFFIKFKHSEKRAMKHVYIIYHCKTDTMPCLECGGVDVVVVEVQCNRIKKKLSGFIIITNGEGHGG